MKNRGAHTRVRHASRAAQIGYKKSRSRLRSPRLTIPAVAIATTHN